MRAEAIKGHVDTALLAVLRSGPAHGYALVRRLDVASEGVFALGEGTVYPALHRLEREGLVVSSWSKESGRRRRVYSLTRNGERALEHRAVEWATLSRGLASVLGGPA